MRSHPTASSTGGTIASFKAESALLDSMPGSKLEIGWIGSPAGVRGTTLISLLWTILASETMPPGAKKVNKIRIKPKIAFASGPSPLRV